MTAEYHLRELTDAELDAVSGGQAPTQTGAQRGLVNVQNVDVLGNSNVGVAVGVLSGVVQRQNLP